jgi:hypothetical protein
MATGTVFSIAMRVALGNVARFFVKVGPQRVASG